MGDMWLPTDQDPRMQGGPTRGERATLVGYLEHYRTTLELKCDGLTPEQLATAAVPPSRISLLGMVRHLARVEHSWFRRVIEGHPEIERLHPDDAGFRLEQERVGPAYVEEAWAAWRTEVAHAREVLARTELDALVTVGEDEVIEVRDVVVHLVEEYARHLGHVDLVREVLDGRTGQ